MDSWILRFCAVYFTIAAAVAFVYGIKDALKDRDSDAISANILVGLFWPCLLLCACLRLVRPPVYAVCTWLLRRFTRACIKTADLIDKFNAEEAKKRVGKGR